MLEININLNKLKVNISLFNNKKENNIIYFKYKCILFLSIFLYNNN